MVRGVITALCILFLSSASCTHLPANTKKVAAKSCPPGCQRPCCKKASAGPKNGYKNGHRETGRIFLARDTVEEEGYGLYSYLLIATEPTLAVRERYLAAIEAWLGLLSEISELEKTEAIPRTRLNAAYLPLNANLADAEGGSADWVLRHYHYVRARRLLHSLDPDLALGPYIVSVRNPLSTITREPDEYLLQDLTNVPTSLLPAWVTQFKLCASEEDFSRPKRLRQFRLTLRTFIARLGIGADDVEDMLAIID